MDRKNEKRKGNHQVEKSCILSVSNTCGSQTESATKPAAVVLFHCAEHCVLRIRASCALFVLVSPRCQSRRQFRVVSSPRLESTYVQSWRSTGSASEVTYHCHSLLKWFLNTFHIHFPNLNQEFTRSCVQWSVSVWKNAPHSKTNVVTFSRLLFHLLGFWMQNSRVGLISNICFDSIVSEVAWSFFWFGHVRQQKTQ